jgi:hypothetical protein
MDYLAIQASAVPCERIFSSSAETNTKRHNRISPTLMEGLQMLKFGLKKARLDFTNDLLTSQEELLDEDPDEPEHNSCWSQQQQLDDLISLALKYDEASKISDAVDLFPLELDMLG